MHDGMLRIHAAFRVHHQRPRHVAARPKPALHAFDKVNVLFHRGLAILHRQRADLGLVGAVKRVPSAPDHDMRRVDHAPMVGVQHVARIDLKREHREQEPTGIFIEMREAGVDIVGHILKALALSRMTQALALRLDIVGFGFDHAAGKGRMTQRAMVAFRVILDRHLPVAGLGNIDPFEWPQIPPIRHPFLKFRPRAGKPLLHRRGVWVEVHEHESKEALGAHFCQADRGFIEPLHRLDVRPGPQLPGQFIGPRVVGAYDHPRCPRAFHQLMRAVLADVVEYSDHFIAAPDRKQALSGNLEGLIRADLRQIRRVAPELPRLRQQPLLFDLKDLRVGVVARL